MGDIDRMTDDDLNSILYQLGTGSVQGSIDYKRSLLRVIYGDVVKERLYDREIALSKDLRVVCGLIVGILK